LSQLEKEPTGAGSGKSVCHFSFQSGLAACSSVEADLDVGLAAEPEVGEGGALAVGWAALVAAELQPPTASAAVAAASQASQASLVMPGPQRHFSGTPSPPFDPDV
jgi:hypothetical protein